ncbi:MAG: sulfite exporter TauE/SafE family protein [Thermodesulfovibrionales bacterium]
MDFFYMLFPVSGVKTYIFIPPLVAFVLSFFTSMGGVSGAFLLLPFQMSYLNFTSPAVSSTNFLYNIVAIPSGVYQYIKDGRMAWPLTMIVIAGTLPGVFLGYYLRIMYLPDPRTFKMFVGCVLLYIGVRLLYEFSGRGSAGQSKVLEEKFSQRSAQLKKTQQSRVASGLPADAVVKTLSVSVKKVVYEFWGETFSFSTPAMFLLALVVGIIGGTYGIGGGAIIAPFCVAIFKLPVYTVAGAALMGTFLTSIVGIIFYTLVPIKNGIATSPDWLLGFLFGIGGFAGMYLGARVQKYMPQKYIKLMLGLLIVYVSSSYIIQFFR